MLNIAERQPREDRASEQRAGTGGAERIEGVERFVMGRQLRSASGPLIRANSAPISGPLYSPSPVADGVAVAQDRPGPSSQSRSLIAAMPRSIAGLAQIPEAEHELGRPGWPLEAVGAHAVQADRAGTRGLARSPRSSAHRARARRPRGSRPPVRAARRRGACSASVRTSVSRRAPYTPRMWRRCRS